MLRRFIAYTRVVDAVKRNAISALIYPAVLFSLSLLVLFGIMVKVVPAFAGLLRHASAPSCRSRPAS